MKIIFIVILGFLLLTIGNAQELPPDNTKVEVDIKPGSFPSHIDLKKKGLTRLQSTSIMILKLPTLIRKMFC
jgi:hypothetical protein